MKPNEVGSVYLYGVRIVSLAMDNKERLCLAQISNTLLKDYSYNEIHNRRVALGITCVQCTPVQLEILRRAGAMPISSRRCGMITKREAERLCKSFLGDNTPPKLPDNFAFEVYHECAWGCRGQFVPSRYNSSRAKCIKCHFCGVFFSPNKFVFHSHRITEADKYVQPDAANFNSWRRHTKLLGDPPEEIVYAWEDIKAMFNGGTRKRLLGGGASHLADNTQQQQQQQQQQPLQLPQPFANNSSTSSTQRKSSKSSKGEKKKNSQHSKNVESSPSFIPRFQSIESLVGGAGTKTEREEHPHHHHPQAKFFWPPPPASTSSSSTTASPSPRPLSPWMLPYPFLWQPRRPPANIFPSDLLEGLDGNSNFKKNLPPFLTKSENENCISGPTNANNNNNNNNNNTPGGVAPFDFAQWLTKNSSSLSHEDSIFG